jgi:hypothetical protein
MVKKNNLPTFLHWFSWTISLVASIFFLSSMLEGGTHNLLTGKIEVLQVISMLAIAGCFLSFFKYKAGGLMMLTGGIAMIVVVAMQHGMSEFRTMVAYGLPYIFSGIVFLFVRK